MHYNSMMSNFGGESRTAKIVTTSLLVAVLVVVVASSGLLLSTRPMTHSTSTNNNLLTFVDDEINNNESLEPISDPETTIIKTENVNWWLVISCAAGVTITVLLLIILIVFIKHQYCLSKGKSLQQRQSRTHESKQQKPQ